jgi:hypothetical protein
MSAGYSVMPDQKNAWENSSADWNLSGVPVANRNTRMFTKSQALPTTLTPQDLQDGMGRRLTLGVSLFANVVFVFVVASMSSQSCSLGNDAEDQRNVRIGNFPTTNHQIEAAAVESVLRNRGYEVDSVRHNSELELFSAFWEGSVDIVPSVWLPDGHSQFFVNKTLGVDYTIVGTTSEESSFYFMASATAAQVITSIDDLVDPDLTANLELEIIFTAPPASSVGQRSIDTIDEINALREGAGLNTFQYRSDYDPVSVREKLDGCNNAACEDSFIAIWYTPFYGNIIYEDLGFYQRLENGDIGDNNLGGVSRAVTITTPEFARSGIIENTDWSALSRVFLGNEQIMKGDSFIFNGEWPTAQDALTEVIENDAAVAYWLAAEGVYSTDNTPYEPGFTCN